MVPNTPRLAGPYDGNDSATSFPFAFKIFEAADLQVVLLDLLDAESALTPDSDYTVTMNADQDANPGGTVTYPVSGSPLATGERLTIRGLLEIEQQTDITNLGGFYPQIYEDALDRLTMLVAQVNEDLDRTVRVPVSLADVDTDLPIPVAGSALIWNEDGTAIVNGVPTESLVALSSFMSNVIQAADAAEARSDIGAAADTAVVKLTGAQTVAGVKTFSDKPIIPDATAAQNPVSKAQLDAEAAARTAAIAEAVAPATLGPTLFVETTPKSLNGLSAVEWTSIPSYVRQILIVIDGQSGSSTGVAAVRIGTGGAAETTGYTGTGSVLSTSTAVAANSTSWLLANAAIAASVHSHVVTINRASGNTWVYAANGALHAGNGTVHGGGDKTLAGALDMVQLIMTSGNFDAGTATLYYR